MKVDVLNPVVTVQVRGSAVQVQELNWKDYLRAVRELTDTVMKFMGKEGEIKWEREPLVAAIQSNESLLSWVLEKSTGLKKDDLEKLKAREVIPLIEAVIDLNLSEDVVGPGKALAARMGEAFGLKRTSPEPAITSSVPATPLAT